jgi:NAD(P)-binding Rossmann-like domain
MHNITTDYLIIGAGASGLAFADTLLSETDAHLTFIDKQAKPGGHWQQAYPFVTLHQPSAFYGVNSLPLGSGQIDSSGLNQGLFELASGAEVAGYFEALMQTPLWTSGRVSYCPNSEYLGDARFRSLLTGEETRVTVRKKVVDATYFSPHIPLTHKPRFAITTGVQLVPPNALPTLAKQAHYAVLGAGKTAMDSVIYLLQQGTAPEQIHWVMPRDSWLINRRTTQPGMAFFNDAIGAQANQLAAFAQASDINDLFLRLEASGNFLRIDRSQTPSMFHLATVSEREVSELQKIKQVIRKGRVQSISGQGLLLDKGEVSLPANTCYIDCTASAVEPVVNQTIFQENLIRLQLVRLPLISFSCALIAYVEAHYDSDKQKNALCQTVPFPHSLADYAPTSLINLQNQFNWGQDKTLRNWIRDSRLDGFGKLLANIAPDDHEKLAIVAKLKEHAAGAVGNLMRLVKQSKAAQ